MRGRGIGLLIGVLLIGGLLALAGYAGYSQGYDTGVAEQIEESATTVVYASDRGFSGVGIFFKFLLFGLLFLFIFKIIGFFAWRRRWGPRGRWQEQWEHQGYGPHSHPHEHSEEDDDKV